MIIDEVTFPALGDDVPWGRFPDGDGPWAMLSAATPGAANINPEQPEDITLYINEFLALNDAGLQDETGAWEDWLELYNPGPDDVAVGGLFLTDDLAVPTQWALPDTVIPAGGHLLVWCDNDPEDGPLHATFKLSGDGETVALFGRIAAGTPVIDSYTFGAQTADVSEGRVTDGGADWTFFAQPTPGAPNSGGSTPAEDLAPAAPRLLPCYPNPFNPHTTLALELPAAAAVRLDILDARGRLVATLVDELLAAGRHDIPWTGTDHTGREAPSGVYFSRLSAGGERLTGRMVLVR